ncbi:uncharacterized protein LOC132740063 [Ruditapes philippinarum]|uniref:uncharacterized protein LOC132740063 n=1 Tax=Ruditapes philippinarum TaxID=129788 RepID=UPI00295B48A2|nr:uncharacterized protein LOC132740063 [Ruditapes philippinarum]
MLILHVSLPLYVIAVLGFVKAAFSCPAQNKSAELRFTVKLGSKDFVRINHDVDIPCCAEGYENITWYKEVNGNWQPVPSESEVLHDGQVLQFLDIQDTDAATYRCYVVGQSKVIYHDTQIVVEGKNSLFECFLFITLKRF